MWQPLLQSHRSSDAPTSVSRIFDVERLGLSNYFLALIFLLVLGYALKQMRRIRRVLGAAFEPQKLFHAFVTIHCALRFVSFGVLSLFVLMDTDVWYPGLVMLFTLPEFFILSTYVLLYFLWLEVYIFAHDQFVVESRRAFRRKWVVVFFVLTLLLYIILSVLYILLILRPRQLEDTVVELILYATALGCLILPVLMLGAAAYFGLLLLSGFTFSNEAARLKVAKMTDIMYVWTFGRVSRGVLLLVSTLYRWQQTLNSTYLGMTIVSVLLVTEVLPLLCVLDWGAIGTMLFGAATEQDLRDNYYTEIAASPSALGPRGDATPVMSPLTAAAQVLQGSLAATMPAGHGALAVLEPGNNSLSHTPLLGSSVPLPTHMARDWEVDLRAVKFVPGTEFSDADDAQTYQQQDAGMPFSTTQLAVYRGQAVAVHTFRLPLEDGDPADQRTLLADLVQDLTEASAVAHPHVARLVGVSVGLDASAAKIYVLTESLSGGSLRQLLRSAPSVPLAPGVVLRYALQIAMGLESLHVHHQVHGHLTSAQVRLDASGTLKLCDVGARRLKAYAEVMLGTRIGEPAYAAPELLRSGSQAASPAADVFALAVLLWELSTRQMPWPGLDASAIFSSVCVHGSRLRLLSSNESALPPAYSKLVAACWHTQPQMRPTSGQIVAQLQRISAQLAAEAPTT